MVLRRDRREIGNSGWIKKPEDLAPSLTLLLTGRAQLDALRDRARELARPHAARDSALAVLKLLAGKGLPKE